MQDNIRKLIERFIAETGEAELIEVDGEEAVRFTSFDSAGETILLKDLRYDAQLGFCDSSKIGGAK